MPITYGLASQPAQSIFNYDALVATTVGLYRKQLIDNISDSMIFWYKFKELGLWESAPGGLYVGEDLMYALAPTDSYEGYDPLPLTPTEGITQAQFQYAQSATPVAISEKERKMNKQRIVSLLDAKIRQAEISIIEFFTKTFLQGGLYGGGGTADVRLPYVSPNNASAFVDPLFKLISYTPTQNVEVGGINQSTATWWQNRAKISAATTRLELLAEILNLRNTCSIGSGGFPDTGLTDQLTWEAICVAYYDKYRTQADTTGNFPFPTIKFHGSLISWDTNMPNVAGGAGGAGDLNTATGKGTFVWANTSFLKLRYEEETNFVAGELDKPINQDAKYKHILFMGATTVSNRKKQGVLGNIARTFTA